jgi:energy-coupling factor transporter ATP-binding protein EcfA2
MDLSGRLATVPAHRLSAGQKRRTALACLVARRAELWLLDEPHAGLDASGRDDLDDTLRQAAASGATVIVASHELERAGALATRSVVVDNGMVFPVAPDGQTPDAAPPGPGTDDPEGVIG